MQAAGFTGVERVSNPMPLHTEILIGKKPKGLPDKHAKNVINS
jgi:hypothetical protein